MIISNNHEISRTVGDISTFPTLATVSLYVLMRGPKSSSSYSVCICTFRGFITLSRVNTNFCAGFSAQISFRGNICWVVEVREGSRLAWLWFIRIRKGFFVCFETHNLPHFMILNTD